MNLPQRDNKHITETSSFKIFSNNIPDLWIIREVTERDYGIDCYIELVNTKGQVTGNLISIQLKGVETIKWTKKDYYTFSGIKISTTNYWERFPIPVFICLVDIKTKETFFTPVKESIRANFKTYKKQKKFSYKIKKSNNLNKSNLENFLMAYFKEKMTKDLEQNINTFISHYKEYQEFIERNIGRDYFMGIEMGRVLYLKHFYYNLCYLCKYFKIDWNLKSIEEYFKLSQERFGDDYVIHEYFADEIVKRLNTLLIPILLKLRKYITEEEKEYWMLEDLQLYNIMINVRDNGEIPYDLL